MGDNGRTQLPAEIVARMLARLYDEPFGGKSSGRYRISRKFLREMAGRRRLPDAFLDRVSEELFEMGFVLVNEDTYFAVLSQTLFGNYRRATKAATARVRQAKTGDAGASDAIGRSDGAVVPRGADA